MQTIVGVKYKNSTKIYSFSAPDFEVKVGDKVVVDTSNGPSLGTIAFGAKQVDDSQLEDALKPVLRVATEKDLNREKRLIEKAEKDMPTIKEKIAELGLDMNVTSVEYSFDETKVTISFTSDGRVDFRELLKILAYTLKCKIELRQIGTRDEVKAIGGMGLCGMECCCTKFLKDAEHVTVKMAKLQSLSLSPTKTGGLCGRMMCCLAFEDPVYKELSKELPEVGKTIKTPEGEGVVSYNDILKQRVTVKIPQGDSGFKIKEFELSELKGEKKIESINEEKKTDVQPRELGSETLPLDVDKANVEEQKQKRSKHKRRHFNNKKGEKKNGI